MGIFNAQLAADIAKHNIGKSCLYNADQTGLFYAKLPNRMFVKKGTEKQYAGTKAMKSKDRATLMVCTNAAGEKVPLAIVGKSKKPKCFSLCEKIPPPYSNQKNAWFDKTVFLWWIREVFWPHHLKEKGDVPCILLLDNFSAHQMKESEKPSKNLHLLMLPPNITSNHQPADMGIIASLKVGFK